MKEQHIGKMVYYGLRFFTWVRNRFGKRWFMVHKTWSVYHSVLGKHFRGIDERGRQFVYCPVSLLVSWSGGDYDHEWCHACGIYYRHGVDEDRTMAPPYRGEPK